MIESREPFSEFAERVFRAAQAGDKRTMCEILAAREVSTQEIERVEDQIQGAEDHTNYHYVTGSTALGETFSFLGPGLRPYIGEIYLTQPMNAWMEQCEQSRRQDSDYRQAIICANKIVHMLFRAYDAGREAKVEEIHRTLGLHLRR